MTSPPSNSAASRWVAWWTFTWLLGSIAGSIVVGVLHSPSRPDAAVGPGAVLAPPIGVLAFSLIALWSCYLAGMWLAAEHVGDGDVRSEYGIAFAPIDLVGLPIGVAAQLVLIRLVYVPLEQVWPDTFSRDRIDDTARDLVDRADGAALLLLVAMVVVGAPVVEELFFRGFLQRPLLRSASTTAQQWLAVVAVALVFGAIHFRPVEFPGLFAFGLVLGVGAWKTGRLGLPIMAHLAFNATGVISVL